LWNLLPTWIARSGGHRDFFPAQISSRLAKEPIMGNLLYLLAIVLIILWVIGYFGYGAGWLIHILLVIAVIAILLRIIRRA
jgi:hypothetical protein